MNLQQHGLPLSFIGPSGLGCWIGNTMSSSLSPSTNRLFSPDAPQLFGSRGFVLYLHRLPICMAFVFWHSDKGNKRAFCLACSGPTWPFLFSYLTSVNYFIFVSPTLPFFCKPSITMVCPSLQRLCFLNNGAFSVLALLFGDVIFLYLGLVFRSLLFYTAARTTVPLSDRM